MKGVLDRLFEALQTHNIICVSVDCIGLDSTSMKVHPDGAGALKNGPQSIGKSRGGWTTKVHMVSANDRCAQTFSLSPSNAHDAVEGRKLSSDWQDAPRNISLVMDRAYEGDETRQLALDLGFEPIVPPKSKRKKKSEFSKSLNLSCIVYNSLSWTHDHCPYIPH